MTNEVLSDDSADEIAEAGGRPKNLAFSVMDPPGATDSGLDGSLLIRRGCPQENGNN